MRGGFYLLTLFCLLTSLSCSSDHRSHEAAAAQTVLATTGPPAITPAVPEVALPAGGSMPDTSGANSSLSTAAAVPIEQPPAVRRYLTLRATPFPADQLPTGYTSLQFGEGSQFFSDLARQQHAVGELDLQLQGPDDRDAIVYLVFPTDADAAAVWSSQPAPVGWRTLSSEAVTGLSYPVSCTSFAAETESQLPVGITACAATSDGVEVIGGSQLQYDAGATSLGGNRDQALVLLQAGMEHLNTAQTVP